MISFQKFAKLYLDEVAPKSDLSIGEERLLTQLVGQWYQINKVSVGKIVGELSETSLATTYKNLHGLREKNYIVVKKTATDARMKYIEPGPAAEKYIFKMDRILNRCTSRAKPKRHYRSMAA